MHDWEFIDGYAQYHPRWFESPSRYEPKDEYFATYTEIMPATWDIRRNGIWYAVTPPGAVQPDQGWKIHVSASTDTSIAALLRTLTVLHEDPTCFKFLIDFHISSLINGKLWPRGASGKFITIYPRDQEQFYRLGQRLADKLKDYAGPYILSDRPWPGSKSVYYRYGGFRARSILQVDGTQTFVIVSPDGELIPDIRNPFWSPPEWAEEPFVGKKQSEAAQIALSNGRYSVTSALAFSNRGGVYKAVDNRTGRDVLLKEARPRVEIGRFRIDAISLLEKEWRLLNMLAATGYFVTPVEFFREGEHAFLVEEFVSGDHLGRYSIGNNPLYHGNVSSITMIDYLVEMRKLWLEIARAITNAHEQGIILGDLSFTNIIITEGSKIRIVDLECAIEEGQDPQVGLHTPGVTSPEDQRSGISDRANDYYALGAITFGSIMLANSMMNFYPPAGPRFLKEVSVDVGMPEESVVLIQELMAPASSQVFERTVAAIEKLDFRKGRGAVQIPRLGQPATQRLGRVQRAELRRHIAQVIEGTSKYLRIREMWGVRTVFSPPTRQSLRLIRFQLHTALRECSIRSSASLAKFPGSYWIGSCARKYPGSTATHPVYTLGKLASRGH